MDSTVSIKSESVSKNINYIDRENQGIWKITNRYPTKRRNEYRQYKFEKVQFGTQVSKQILYLVPTAPIWKDPRLEVTDQAVSYGLWGSNLDNNERHGKWHRTARFNSWSSVETVVHIDGAK